MRVGIAKPDFGIRGGFEMVLDRLVDHLSAVGHEVSWIHVDVSERRRRISGLEISDEVWVNAAEYFRYVSTVEQFALADAGRADVVLCTQPGSWAVDHPRKLALFYHHHRVFYDLADSYVEAGFADPVFHEPCTEEVRSIDRPLLDDVAHFLVPSADVAARLADFNAVGEDRRSSFHAGYALDARPAPPASVDAADGDVLCVSRHEWPKRTELMVAVAHRLRAMAPGSPGRVVLIGDGGRLGHLRALDRQLQADGIGADGVALWLPAAPVEAHRYGPLSSNLKILGRVTSEELAVRYATALCVVAPAYREDYGLTAIEGMTHGKPVIVCTDGGGLVDAVRDGENGLVVAPTATAIATAAELLRSDGALRRRLSAGALETAAQYRWERAFDELDLGLERVASR